MDKTPTKRENPLLPILNDYQKERSNSKSDFLHSKDDWSGLRGE